MSASAARRRFNGDSPCAETSGRCSISPRATEIEIRDASLQFVRKLSGFSVPSKANEEAFERAVDAVAASARALIASLVTSAAPHNREVETAKARARSVTRFGSGA